MVGCSEGVRRATESHLRLPPGRTVRIDNLVEVEQVLAKSLEPLPFERDPDRFVVVHAGRLHDQKNQAMLLDAFATLGPRAELWMLGEGPDARRLERRAARLGIAGRVRWFGFRDNPFPFLRAADCLALSSHFEGLPNVVIEAMACGTPVVSTRCPYGPDELIEHEATGLLVPVDDTSAFAEALARMKDAPDERARMGERAATATRTRFSAAESAKRFQELFLEVLERHGASPAAGGEGHPTCAASRA
ncbi:MAG: glycosyltransferase [Acidobacteria bacterium]|nr:MAG: glycosyltransferase [Acidobacteriota bacterium]